MSLHGLLVVDKPAGMTSHDVVSVLRRVSRQKKIGHTGTLDPAATGVLVLCFGSATRLIQYLEESDKVYEAHMILGIVTDTQDYTGQVLAEDPAAQVVRDSLVRVMEKFLGEQLQVPPMFSAVKRGGRPLYELARQGQEVERAARRMVIYELAPARPLAEKYRAGEGPWLRIRCSKGTYIRTLCHDMGQALGCGAHLRELRRLASGVFTLDQAVSLEQAKTWGEEGVLAEHLLSPALAVQHLPQLELSEEEAVAIRHGRALYRREVAAEGTIGAAIRHGELVAILQSQASGIWQPVRVFMGE